MLLENVSEETLNHIYKIPFSLNLSEYYQKNK